MGQGEGGSTGCHDTPEPGWQWMPDRRAYVWWDGKRHVASATWDGSSWQYRPLDEPSPSNIFAVIGFSLAWLNVGTAFLVSIYLSPIAFCLGVAGFIRARKVGAMMGLSVATIVLSLVPLVLVWWLCSSERFRCMWPFG